VRAERPAATKSRPAEVMVARVGWKSASASASASPLFVEWAIDVCRLPLLGCRWRWRVVTSQRWRKSVPALAGMGDLRLERRVELRWERRARVSEMV